MKLSTAVTTALISNRVSLKASVLLFSSLPVQFDRFLYLSSITSNIRFNLFRICFIGNLGWSGTSWTLLDVAIILNLMLCLFHLRWRYSLWWSAVCSHRILFKVNIWVAPLVSDVGLLSVRCQSYSVSSDPFAPCVDYIGPW